MTDEPAAQTEESHATIPQGVTMSAKTDRPDDLSELREGYAEVGDDVRLHYQDPGVRALCFPAPMPPEGTRNHASADLQRPITQVAWGGGGRLATATGMATSPPSNC